MVDKLVKWVVLTLNLSKLAIFCLQNLEPFLLGMARIWTTSYPVNRAQGTLYNKLLIIFFIRPPHQGGRSRRRPPGCCCPPPGSTAMPEPGCNMIQQRLSSNCWQKHEWPSLEVSTCWRSARLIPRKMLSVSKKISESLTLVQIAVEHTLLSAPDLVL